MARNTRTWCACTAAAQPWDRSEAMGPMQAAVGAASAERGDQLAPAQCPAARRPSGGHGMIDRPYLA